jgi:hypothetical protein
MSSSQSARPPSSSRRAPDLDSPEARAFVEAAADPVQISSKQGREGDKTAASQRVDMDLPPASARQRETLRPLTLRIPESLHAHLLYIADNSNKSMNQFVIDALGPAVSTQIEKIARRKELGLD